MRCITLLIALLSLLPNHVFAGDQFQFDWLRWGTHISDHVKTLGPRLREEYSLAEVKRMHGEDDYAYGSYTKQIDGIRFGVHPIFDNKTDTLAALQVAYVKIPSLRTSKLQCSCEDLERKVKDIIKALTTKYDKKKEVHWEAYGLDEMNGPNRSSANITFYSIDTIVEMDYVDKNPRTKTGSPATPFTCRLSLMYSKIPF